MGGLTNREVSQVFKQVAPCTPILTTGGKLSIRVALSDIMNQIRCECKYKAKLADAKKAVANALKNRGLKDEPNSIIPYADKDGQKAVDSLHSNSKAKDVPLSKRAGLTVSTDLVAAWNKSIADEGLVYITAVLEYLCAELCELTANCANPKEFPSKVKLETHRGAYEVGVIDSDDEDEFGDWAVQDIYLAEAHHVLKAIFNDKEMSKAFPNYGASLQSVHWSAYLAPEDDDEKLDAECEDDGDDDESVSSKKAGKAKAGTSKGITKTGRVNKCSKCGAPKKGHVCQAADK